MNKLLGCSLIGLCFFGMNSVASTLELKPENIQFIAKAAKYNVSQRNWDQAANAAVTFPQAYQFTPHIEILPIQHSWAQSWRGSLVNLLELTASDLDGEHSLEVLLRDRLNNHSMVVVQKGQLLHQHFFNGFDANQTHLQMSVTKSFVAILAAISVAEGKLDMSQRLIHYLPELTQSGFEDVTVQEVADMRSGIGVAVADGKSWDPRMSAVQDWNGHSNDAEFENILDYANELENYRPIGKVYDYLDINTEVLAKVVERVQGKPLAEVFANKLWHRLGVEQPARWMANRQGELVASGGLNISTRDLARVGQVLVNKGKNLAGEQVVPAAFIDSLLQGNDQVRHAWQQGKEASLAKGWYQDQFRTLYLPSHTGETYKVLAMVGIHGQVLIMEPESQTVIAMNSGFAEMQSTRMARLIFNQLVPAILDKVLAVEVNDK